MISRHSQNRSGCVYLAAAERWDAKTELLARWQMQRADDHAQVQVGYSGHPFADARRKGCVLCR